MLNTESAGQGPIALIPFAFAASTAGPISVSSSVPNNPLSPLCGFNPATAISGFSIPTFLNSLSMLMTSSRMTSFVA